MKINELEIKNKIGSSIENTENNSYDIISEPLSQYPDDVICNVNLPKYAALRDLITRKQLKEF